MHLDRRPALGCHRLIQARDIARQHVDLQIDARAGLQRPQRRLTLRMRDDIDLKTPTVHGIHRQGNTVDGDRSLLGDETRQRGGGLKLQAKRIAGMTA